MEVKRLWLLTTMAGTPRRPVHPVAQWVVRLKREEEEEAAEEEAAMVVRQMMGAMTAPIRPVVRGCRTARTDRPLVF